MFGRTSRVCGTLSTSRISECRDDAECFAISFMKHLASICVFPLTLFLVRSSPLNREKPPILLDVLQSALGIIALKAVNVFLMIPWQVSKPLVAPIIPLVFVTQVSSPLIIDLGDVEAL